MIWLTLHIFISHHCPVTQKELDPLVKLQSQQENLVVHVKPDNMVKVITLCMVLTILLPCILIALVKMVEGEDNYSLLFVGCLILFQSTSAMLTKPIK